jgi:hypothetical protein
MDVVDDTIPYWPFGIAINPLLMVLYLKQFYSSLDKQNIMKKILGYLDYECLRHAVDVCLSWKKIIADEKLWEKLLQRNVCINVITLQILIQICVYCEFNIYFNKFLFMSVCQSPYIVTADTRLGENGTSSKIKKLCYISIAF